jgi:hypothetical protein
MARFLHPFLEKPPIWTGAGCESQKRQQMQWELWPFNICRITGKAAVENAEIGVG